jgi:hypothetical protein
MTDKRWKAVERGVAAELNQVLSGIGNYSPIERIPLLGRDGPDLTMNESGLVINVKSRQAILDRLFPKERHIITIGGAYICFRLKDLPAIIAKQGCFHYDYTDEWVQLSAWYATMNLWTEGIRNGMSTTTIMRHSQMPVKAWTNAFKSNCISAIILHRPRMPYGNCGVVIHYENLRRLSCNLTRTTN